MGGVLLFTNAHIFHLSLSRWRCGPCVAATRGPSGRPGFSCRNPILLPASQVPHRRRCSALHRCQRQAANCLFRGQSPIRLRSAVTDSSNNFLIGHPQPLLRSDPGTAAGCRARGARTIPRAKHMSRPRAIHSEAEDASCMLRHADGGLRPGRVSALAPEFSVRSTCCSGEFLDISAAVRNALGTVQLSGGQSQTWRRRLPLRQTTSVDAHRSRPGHREMDGLGWSALTDGRAMIYDTPCRQHNFFAHRVEAG